MNLPATDIQGMTLSLTREFNASREKVFQAWTDPQMLKKWFSPQGVTTQSAQIDLRVGGKYQLVMQEPDGKTHTPHGEYREIDPPRKLVFTWILDGQVCEGSEGEFAETVVTVEFHDLGAATRLVLSHDFLPSEKSKEAHAMGWKGCLDHLEVMLA